MNTDFFPPLPQVQVVVRRDANNKWECVPQKVEVKELNTLIFFNLNDPEFRFDRETPLTLGHPSDSFPDPAIRRSSTQLTLIDLNLRPGTIDYTLDLVHRATGEHQRVMIDPQIGNQPS